MRAETVQVDGVEGQVLYGAGNHTPHVPVKAGQKLATNAILYLSTFTGSELRLAEAGTLHFYGVEEACQVAHLSGHRSTFRLLVGKLRITIRHPEEPPHCYRIMLAGGGASVESGQCVICGHGDGTYLYVARGVTLLSGSTEPHVAAPPRAIPVDPEGASIMPVPEPRTDIVVSPPTRMTGNGNIGWLGADGVVQVKPLAAVGPATQSCLLAGLHADAVAGASPNHAVDSSLGLPVVSPTQ
jgi:hypothetical protein